MWSWNAVERMSFESDRDGEEINWKFFIKVDIWIGNLFNSFPPNIQFVLSKHSWCWNLFEIHVNLTLFSHIGWFSDVLNTMTMSQVIHNQLPVPVVTWWEKFYSVRSRFRLDFSSVLHAQEKFMSWIKMEIKTKINYSKENPQSEIVWIFYWIWRYFLFVVVLSSFTNHPSLFFHLMTWQITTFKCENLKVICMCCKFEFKWNRNSIHVLKWRVN